MTEEDKVSRGGWLADEQECTLLRGIDHVKGKTQVFRQYIASNDAFEYTIYWVDSSGKKHRVDSEIETKDAFWMEKFVGADLEELFVIMFRTVIKSHLYRNRMENYTP